ncbi:MAG TPA: DUF2939 domain-containing protein [Candidatus Binatia bacterium]|nr:DUF2939 domain-containing protein [Candidatus Binatia bacterium]
MRRGFVPGLVIGAAVALAVGFCAAVLPATPTWTLWRIKRALDHNDTAELQQLVDVPRAAARALTELATGSKDPVGEPLDYRELGAALLGGGKVYTVFNDPERPLRLTAGDFVAAWWNMRREGDEVFLTIDVDGRPVSLVFGRTPSGEWRVVGLTPLSALVRVKRAPPPERRSPATRRDGGSPSRG